VRFDFGTEKIISVLCVACALEVQGGGVTHMSFVHSVRNVDVYSVSHDLERMVSQYNLKVTE
jgi:hypothetical protein